MKYKLVTVDPELVAENSYITPHRPGEGEEAIYDVPVGGIVIGNVSMLHKYKQGIMEQQTSFQRLLVLIEEE